MSQRRGFTLIEVIISTAVILLILAVSLPAFLDFQRRQNLRTGAQLVRDAILETQNYALAPRAEKDVGADHYRILFGTGEASGYLIQEEKLADIDHSNDPTCPAKKNDLWCPIKKANLPYSVVICILLPPSLALSTGSPTESSTDQKNGLAYSISQLAKISNPTTPNQFKIYIQQKTLVSQLMVTVDRETGRVDVQPADPAVNCS